MLYNLNSSSRDILMINLHHVVSIKRLDPGTPDALPETYGIWMVGRDTPGQVPNFRIDKDQYQEIAFRLGYLGIKHTPRGKDKYISPKTPKRRATK
jgi:hypothetical protein